MTRNSISGGSALVSILAVPDYVRGADIGGQLCRPATAQLMTGKLKTGKNFGGSGVGDDDARRRPHHVAAHPAEPDHSELHRASRVIR